MKTFYDINRQLYIKISVFLILILSGINIYAQDEQPKDTIGYNKGKMEIKNPPSIVSAYTYDPITDQYIYTNTLGGFNTTYPVILSPDEYRRMVLKESMRDYFRKKNQAIDGKVAGSEDKKKNLLPRYYVNSSFFETIFGSNTIDVKPTGTVEVDLGVRHTKQDNPAFSPRNRSSTTFDFTQRISVGLKGKVGTRLSVNANYDTQSTFAFQNLIKLEFAPNEDDILQKIEVGNVSMPLSGTLIKGAQSLFGVKAQLKFGNTTITGIYSEQKSKTKTVTAQGGGTVQNFDLFGINYDTNRHFFLSQYFRNRYDHALKSYPVIDSRVQIKRIEVWITNKQNRVSTTENNVRNIIALQDLGEAQQTGYQDYQIVGTNTINHYIGPTFFTVSPDSPSDNKNNKFDPGLFSPPNSATGAGILNSNIREISTINNGFNNFNQLPAEGRDWAKLENARKLTASEFTYNAQLGYISLQQKLANDEVLAVAYQYTVGDQVYQVGEFANDGIESTQVTSGVPTTQSLVLKLLKSSLTPINTPISDTNPTTVTTPLWNSMMKNIYQIPGAYQLQQADFRFNIVYSDPSPLNYIIPANSSTPLPANVEQTPLLNVFNVDRLNSTNDPQEGGDGFFDFIPGLTVDPQNGRIIFTTVEPFGKYLFDKLKTGTEDYENPLTYNANQAKYVYTSLYKSSQTAALQDSDKNKFELKGKFKSTGADGIPLGAVNVPRGSVHVTAGGRTLVEGVDYTVNYQQGRVQILDPSLQASNTPIQVSVENNSVFGQQTRRFSGINIEHKFSDKFMIGATYLKMTEKPFTQKSVYGQESVNNSIFGFNTSFSTEVPFLTRLVNKLPNIDTDVPSNISFKGEVAFLKPDTPKADKFNGESTIYVDDFEGSQSTIDMRSPQSWTLASTPKKEGTAATYDDFGANATDVSYGYKRARINWYSIDPTFYTDNVTGNQNDVSLNKTRRIYSDELYPQTVIAAGQSTVVNTLDLSYYPKDRGPYNFNSAAASNNVLPNPDKNWGGIMRPLTTTDFEQTNVQFIQFWVLDPYVDSASGQPAAPTNVGKIYFNLGEISEDILQDNLKQYENGLPSQDSSQITTASIWGKVPASQSLIYAFDTNEANRTLQDVGLDGLNDADEAAKFPAFASQPDPAADNYQYYLAATGDVLNRYKNYNNVQGNSPVNVTDSNRGNTTLPDAEDINRDNTMNTINAYYEYGIDIDPTKMHIGNRFVSDEKTVTGIALPNGGTTTAHWVQYKIPITTPDNVVGGISDFRSIQFMRMFMTGFTDNVTVRFGSLDLVRGEWIRYVNALDVNHPIPVAPAADPTTIDVLGVDIQENSQRVPIPYVTPPGVVLEQLYSNNTLIPQNEKSLSIRVSGNGLQGGDSRGVYKNVNVDMRQYKKLRMFLHAESLTPPNDVPVLNDNQMVGFIRFGNDLSQDFYEVELPLTVTPFNTPAANVDGIWPLANQIDLSLSLLTQLKILANGSSITPDANGIKFQDEGQLDPSLINKVNKLTLGIKGNPNFGLVRTLMVGVKNKSTGAIKGEVWYDELRLSGLDNKGGMAAVVSLNSNVADFATITATGKMNTIGFGSLEQSTNERSLNDLKLYDFVSNVNLGKLLPKKWGINLPFNYGVGEQVITPKYDPFNQDIELQQLLSVTQNQDDKNNIMDRAIDYTKRKSINFIGVRKERVTNTGSDKDKPANKPPGADPGKDPSKPAATPPSAGGKTKKQHFYDPENLTLSYSYNEVLHHDYEIKSSIDQQVKTSVDYNFTFQPKPFEPFKKVKYFKKSSYWKMLSDFNFNYLPTTVNFSTNILRQYNRQEYRQVDVEGIGLDPLYRRNYMFNYQYGFNYNLTKSLKLNYTASTNNIVRNYLNDNNVPDPNNTIWSDYWNIGVPNQHNQQLVLNYELPLNKLPFLSFIKSTYTYTGNYSWQRSSQALSSFTDDSGVTYDLGNTVQNSGAHKLNATLNMESFYKYIGLGKKTPKPAKNVTPKAAPKPGEKIQNTTVVPQNDGNIFLNGLIGVVTSVKNIQIDYTQNQGTVLPGYLPSIGFLGSSRPSLGFTFGLQDDVRYEAAKNGWLTNYPNFNQNYTQVTTKTLNFTSTVDLFPDFKIDLLANRTYSENYSEQYDVSSGDYNSRSPYSTGNFAISTTMIKTAFKTSDEYTSTPFQDFRNNRIIVADRLATQRGIDINNPANLDADGFPVGYGKNSQAVLLPSFLAAYTGFGILDSHKGETANKISLDAFRDIPIPSWTVKYSGLMRYKYFKDHFKRFSIQHAYKASYTVNSFRSNLDYNLTPNGVDTGGNYLNKTIISNINLVEQFNPLVRVDFETKSAFKILAEMKKDRALSMSFDNSLLTEVKGMEYVFGVGYRIKDVVINSRMADNATGVIKSDINIKADFSLRNTQTIVRHLDYDNNQLAGGQNIWSLKLTADYAFSKYLTAIFFYDHSFSKAVISTSFPMTNIRSGFTIRYNFGN